MPTRTTERQRGPTRTNVSDQWVQSIDEVRELIALSLRLTADIKLTGQDATDEQESRRAIWRAWNKLQFVQRSIVDENRIIQTGSPFETMNDVQTHNRRTGHHFFDNDTLKWFSSSVSQMLHGGRYFVTSEQDKTSMTPRAYTVRYANDDGSIKTIGEFMEYETYQLAHAAASQMTDQDEQERTNGT